MIIHTLAVVKDLSVRGDLGHAVIHGVCVFLGEGLARRLLDVLLHELLLVEFLLATRTSLVN